MVSSYYSKNVVKLNSLEKHLLELREGRIQITKTKNSNMLFTNHGKLVGYESLILRFSNDLFPVKELVSGQLLKTGSFLALTVE